MSEVSKVHSWLQVGCIIGGLAWIGGKMDARLAFIEQAQTVYASELLSVKKNQQVLMTAMVEKATNVLKHEYTSDNFMVVTDPNGDAVQLIIMKRKEFNDEAEL